MKRSVSDNGIRDQFKVTDLELVYRSRQKAIDRPKVTEPQTAWCILLENWDMNRIELVEEFKIILMNRASYCLGISTVSSGGMTQCLVDPRVVFATALTAGATSLILAHNHPSGNLVASQADIALTQRLKEAGKLLEIEIPDHLIVTPHGYCSMAEYGLI